MVRELPDLVEALRPALGEVIDIRLNWSAESVTPLMGAHAAAATEKTGGTSQHHRVMAFGGRGADARLLVVPAVTPGTLALMVLRHAGGRFIPEQDRAGAVYERAERIVRAARVESSSWDGIRAGEI
mgnify:CR=1 FL=1